MKKILKVFVAALFAAVMTVTLFIPALEASAANVGLNRTKIVLVAGQAYTLRLTGTKKTPAWSSSDKKIASVSKKGVFKGLKKGSATIQAKLGKKTYKCRVTVEEPKISLTKKTVKAGTSFALKLNGTKRTASWYTSDKKIASVNKNGVVKALRAGKARITAKLGGKSYVCAVTVTKAENKLSKKEIVKILTNANDWYDGWVCHGWNVRFDRSDRISQNGVSYYRVTNSNVRSIAGLKKKLDKYFSPEIYKDRLETYYRMHNGKLYAIGSFGQGGDMPPSKFKLTVLRQTASYCKFTVTSYYDYGYGSYDTAYEMKKINGRWLFVNSFTEGWYNLDNIKWIY